ncbi:MAG: AAA family ATPase [Haliangiales bacterium]
MINSIQIERFRCFERFEASGFGRVNLLVGTNNCGKTALLEAIELCVGHNDPTTLYRMLARRGEELLHTGQNADDFERPVEHLFYGHELDVNSQLTVTIRQQDYEIPFEMSVQSRPPDSYKQMGLFDLGSSVLGAEEQGSPRVLRLGLSHSVNETSSASSADEAVGRNARIRDGYYLQLSPNDGLLPPRYQRETASSKPLTFVPTQSLTSIDIVRMFSEIVLTDEEDLLTRALQIIEPDIERLALTAGNVVPRRLEPISIAWRFERSGIVLRCRGQRQRIPIGSMGDGIWRILALTLALVNTRGGVVLIDEIDTGLHFSVMAEMWKLVLETAERLDIQVFATSHSRDCYESLASVLKERPQSGQASIHRIERDRGRTVVFDQEKIVIAAERDIEIR